MQKCVKYVVALFIALSISASASAEDNLLSRSSAVTDARHEELLEAQKQAKTDRDAAQEERDTAEANLKLVEGRIEELKEAKKTWEEYQATIAPDFVAKAKKKLEDLETKIAEKKQAIKDAETAAAAGMTSYEDVDRKKDADDLEKLRQLVCGLLGSPEAAEQKSRAVRLMLAKKFGDELLARGNGVTIEDILAETIAEILEEIAKTEALLLDTLAGTDPFTSDPVEAKKGLKTLFNEAEEKLNGKDGKSGLKKVYDQATEAVRRYQEAKAATEAAKKLEEVAEATRATAAAANATAKATEANTEAIEKVAAEVSGLKTAVEETAEETQKQIALLTTEVKGVKLEIAKAIVVIANIKLTQADSTARDEYLAGLVKRIEKLEVSEAAAKAELEKATAIIKQRAVPVVVAAPQVQQQQAYVSQWTGGQFQSGCVNNGSCNVQGGRRGRYNR